MPAVSQAQRAYLNAKFGHDWVKAHGFDNKGKLPMHVVHQAVQAHKRKHKKRKTPPARPHGARPGGIPAGQGISQANLQAVKDMLLLRSAARTR